MIKKLYIGLIVGCLVSSSTYSQTRHSRSFMQQNFAESTVLKSFSSAGWKPLILTSTSQIDSLFKVFQTGWERAAPDSLKRYDEKQMTASEFKNVDAYCYLWLLWEVTQNIDLKPIYRDHLASNYLIPAMHRDYALLRRSATPGLLNDVYVGNLQNTLTICLKNKYSSKTFLEGFAVYQEFKFLLDSLAAVADTAVARIAKKQSNSLDEYYYPYNARYSLYKGELDKAYALFLTGMNVDNYPVTYAVSLAREMISELKGGGSKNAQDKVFAILNALAIHTTPESLKRDSLKAWYLQAGHALGGKMYASIRSKLSASSFKIEPPLIHLPKNWKFALNAVSPERLKHAKYIVIDFWYYGCGPCMMEIPELNALNRRIQPRKDVVFTSVNCDYIHGKVNQSLVKEIKKLGIDFPVFVDNKGSRLNEQLSVVGYPTKFILNVKGNVIAKTDNSPMSVEGIDLFLREHRQDERFAD